MEGGKGGQVVGSFVQGTVGDMEHERVGPIVEFKGLIELFNQLAGLCTKTFPPIQDLICEDLED